MPTKSLSSMLILCANELHGDLFPYAMLLTKTFQLCITKQIVRHAVALTNGTN